LPRFVRPAQVVARLAATTVIVIGASGLFGWAANVPWLRSPIVGFVPMVPNVALALVLSALSLGLSVRPSLPRRKLAIALALVSAAFFLAVLRRASEGYEL